MLLPCIHTYTHILTTPNYVKGWRCGTLLILNYFIVITILPYMHIFSHHTIYIYVSNSSIKLGRTKKSEQQMHMYQEKATLRQPYVKKH